MIKIVMPSSFKFDQQITSLVPVHSKGVDSGWLRKTAAVLTKELSEIRPEDGKTHVHLIALGDQETYGLNRNGDGFPKSANTGYHDTFVKYAKWFHNHKNKPSRGDRVYGNVKASAYNPDMHRVELIVAIDNDKDPDSIEKLAHGEDLPVSMACFPTGTLIQFPDRTEKPIESIGLGEEVLTHTGKIRPVTALMSREYTGDLAVVHAYGVPGAIRATLNHNIWVRPTPRGKAQRCPVCGRTFKSLMAHLRQQKDAQHKLAYKDYGRYAEGWVPAEQLAPGDYVRTPFDKSVTDGAGSTALATVLGYYLSEGNVFDYHRNTDKGYNKGVDFSLGGHEQHLVNELTSALSALGYSSKTYKRKNNVLLVRVSSVALHDQMLELGGKYSYGKAVHSSVMHWPLETQKSILRAFINGDGHFSKSSESLVMTTVSRRLAWQLAEMCWRLGIPARLGSYRTKQSNRRTAYTVTIQARYTSIIPCSKMPADYGYSDTYSKSIGHLLHQESGAIVTMKATAKVLAYVEKGFVYRRIRSVAREPYAGTVYNLTVADDHSYVVEGVAVANCKVPYDVCTICGNKAKTASEYCTHIKEACTQMTEDGRHIGMINTEPTFFDISKVHRNADRIAFSLRKVAHHSPVILSTDLAATYGITEPSSLVKDARYHRRLENLRKLAKLEKEIEGEIKANPALRTVASGLNEPTTEKLTDIPEDRLPAVLGKLASDRVILSMPDFYRVVLGSRFNEVEPDLQAAQACLPGVFSGALKTAEDFMCGVDNYTPVLAPLPALMKAKLEKVGQQIGLGSAVGPKAVSFALRKVSSICDNKTQLQPTSEIGRILADEYARYKLAALDRVEDPVTIKLAVLQDFGY